MQDRQNPSIDSGCLVELRTIVKTYRSLRSLTCNLLERATIGDVEEIAQGQLHIQRPGSILIKTALNGVTNVSAMHNGRRLVKTARTVNVTKCDVSLRSLRLTLDASRSFVTPVVPILLTEDDAMKRLIPGGMLRVGRGTPHLMDGVQCETIAIDTRTSKGIARFVITVGQRDHIIRKIDLTAPNPRGLMSLSSIYTQVRVDEPVPSTLFDQPFKNR